MNSLIRYPGSKWTIADWLISNFPKGYEDMTYLEAYFGTGACFMKKRRSKIETINDLDNRVVNLYQVVRDNPDELLRLIKNTPWSRQEYEKSYEVSEKPLEDARRFLVRMWQAIGGKTSDITGWSNNIKPVDSGKSRWWQLDNIIEATAGRLRALPGDQIQIERKNALDLIKRYNFSYVFMYIDPPYILSTRSKRLYKHEMTEDDHEELLKELVQSDAKIMISGYDNDLYNRYLKDWNKKEHKARTEFQKEAVEVIWFNYDTDEQLRMF